MPTLRSREEFVNSESIIAHTPLRLCRWCRKRNAVCRRRPRRPDGESYVNVVEAYDSARNVWTTKTPLPENRNFVGLGSVNGILHAAGGVKLVSSGPDSPPCGFGPCFKFVDDPITYAFKPLP